jgi:hypothetical protein
VRDETPRKPPTSSYLAEQIEYLRPQPPPEADPFDDPEEIDEVLALTLRSIEEQST